MPYLDNHLITLNSQDGLAQNGTSLSSIVFPFKGLLKDDVNIIRSYIQVINAQIPASFYVIDSTNNLLTYNYNATGYNNITVPIGNYNATTLMAVYNNYFTGVSIPVTVTFNSSSGCLSFVASSGTIALYPNGQRSTTISQILGFTSVLPAVANRVLPYPLNLLGKEKLFVNSSKLYNVAYTSLNAGFSTSIVTIPVNVPPFSLIQYSSFVDATKNILVNRVLDMIDLQIVDSAGAPINFNNAHWSITLVLSIERMDANKFHIQSFGNYLSDDQPIQPEEVELDPPEKDKELEFLMGI